MYPGLPRAASPKPTLILNVAVVLLFAHRGAESREQGGRESSERASGVRVEARFHF